MQTDTLLNIRGLSVRLPEGADRPYAVEDLDLEVRKSEILCVVGESGSGKSVTGQAILGLLATQLTVEAGSIHFEGHDLLHLSPRRMRRIRGNRIATIFQEPMTALNPLWRVGAQVEEVIRRHSDLGRRPRRERVLTLFEEVLLPGPAEIYDAYPHQLSGGQRQRVMIAMALAMEPRLLIADEPTTALDVTTQAQILSLIRTLQRRHGTGVLFVTHDFGVVSDIADRVVVMQHGRKVEEGPTGQVLNAPRHPYTRALIDAVLDLSPPARVAELKEPLLSVRGLHKEFGGGSLFRRGRRVRALEDVSFTVARGEALGVVGESGSGKTTLARCLLRIEDPDAGEIALRETPIGSLQGRALRQHRRRIQLVFQDPYSSLNPRHRVGDIIAQGPINYGARRHDAWAKACDLLNRVGLGARAATRFPNQFSGGQRQRISIARALALDPELLVADEPVSALDVSVQVQVLDLIAELRESLGLTLVFVTHDLRVAAQVCDRLIVMHKGRIVEDGPTAEIFANPSHDYTRALLEAAPGRHWRRRAATLVTGAVS